MDLQILVYRKGTQRHLLIWTVKAKSVKQAVHRIASLIRVHTDAHPDCPGFDSFTVSSRRPGNGLWRIAEAGRIPDAHTAQPNPDAHAVAV